MNKIQLGFAIRCARGQLKAENKNYVRGILKKVGPGKMRKKYPEERKETIKGKGDQKGGKKTKRRKRLGDTIRAKEVNKREMRTPEEDRRRTKA